ncbi:MAG: ABC transporter ATP-binding protein [Angustibacter sp.]
MTDMPVDVEGLVVRFGKRTALDGLSLQLGVGVNGLLGPNGAGKTTLFRVLATIARPDAGRVRIAGRDPLAAAQLREVRRTLGYLPQSFGYYPHFTVREFVEYLAWLKEVPRSRVPIAVDHALDVVGLSDRADDRMRSLSGGMLRRAGIAQAIVNDPQLVLLDEPTVGLDPEQRVGFRELLRQLGSSACVVVSTHLVEDVAATSTSVTVVDAGRRLWQGTAQNLVDQAAPGATGDTPIERGYTTVLRTYGAAGRGLGGAA